MRALLMLSAACVVVGCASGPHLTATELAQHAARNLMDAQQTFAGRRVVMRGVVQDTASANSPAQRPLVVLQPGSVLCYVDRTDIDNVAYLKQGDSVAFRCKVEYFKFAREMALSVLSDCRRLPK